MKPAGRQSFLVETNIFLRFLTGDDPSKTLACQDFFERAERKAVDLYTNELVLAELAWTLRSFYRLSVWGPERGEVQKRGCRAPQAIISGRGLSSRLRGSRARPRDSRVWAPKRVASPSSPKMTADPPILLP